MAQPLPSDEAAVPDPANGPKFPHPIPQLLEPPATFPSDTSMRDTPDVSTDMHSRLKLETSEEDEDDDYDDSLLSDNSSDADEMVALTQRGLPVSTLPTGLCYDERMRYHAEVAAVSGENVHPEDPRRIYYIYKELCEAGLVDDKKYPPMVAQPLYRIDARQATQDECLLVHTPEHYEFVKRTASMTDAELIDLSEHESMDSIYFNALSYFASKLSAGAAIETCKAVVSRKVKNAIAVIRPPGHHAEVHRTMGFCLFNNVCIASRVCQNVFGPGCKKILIVDWDVHHGNGCQKAFYEDPNILYISIHVHMNGGFYPSGPEGDMYHCGARAGVGKNINIPWPNKGMGDGDYMYAFQHVVMPVAMEFDPDFVIVASGFDAAAGDELGGCFVTPPCYAHMTHMLMSLAGGKVAVCLEGGYNFSAISKSALAVTRTLMGEPPDRLDPTAATISAVDTVNKVRTVHSKYWRSLYPKDPVGGIFGGERLHDIIRQWQATHLFDKYRLTQLHINRETVSKSFEQQVLATTNYDSKKFLLIIFHDAPDLLGCSTSLTTQQKTHDTWLILVGPPPGFAVHSPGSLEWPYQAHKITKVDGAQSYIRWAVNHGVGVIDVNVPEHITVPSSRRNGDEIDDVGDQEIDYASKNTDLARKEGENLALYLWENYVEPYFADGIFLMGAGHAFHAVAKLVSENDNVYPSLLGIIGFMVTHPIRPVSNASNHWVSQWYRDNSHIYVSNVHSLWKKEARASKRYGKLIKSRGQVLNQMMKIHEEEVTTWMDERIKDALATASSAEDHDDEDDETRESDGDTIEDPAVNVDSITVGTNPSPAAPPLAPSAPPAASSMGGADIVMTTEQL